LMLTVVSFLGFVGCLAVIAGVGGSGNGDGEVSYAEAKKRAVPIGERAKAGKVSWTVHDAWQASELKSFGQKRRGNFIIVRLTFTNNDTEPVTLDSASLALLDDKGRTHETDTDASMYTPANQELFLNQVNPGVSREGRAIFDVAPDASGLILRCGDTNPFVGKNAYVDLST
jgi:Domain of unknown function (DUF4352)